MGGPSQPGRDEGTGVIRRQTSVSRAMPRNCARRRANTDTVKLLMLGYRQELAREFTLFNSFGSSFTALSSLTALSGTYYIGLTYGGPIVMMWGWIVVTAFTASVGLSMAELASAYPTSGALYYWSYKLAPKRIQILACWITAWILTMGQAAFSASNFYTFVHLICAAVQVQYSVVVTPVQQFLILLGMLSLIGLLNCGSARLTAFMITLGTMWHIVALAAFCIVVPLIAPERQSVKYVYTSWQSNHESTGISSPIYITLVGLLMTQWTLTGYDGAAHLAEETFHAEVNVPRAILLTIAGVGISGYAFILALTFVKFDLAVLLDPSNETGGTNVVLQILIEITKATFGSVTGGVALFTVPIVGTFFCSYQSIANNSRMLYAFARDNGVPLSQYAKRVHPRTNAPVYGVLYMLLLTSLLATPMCFNVYVFPAVTSFAVVGCYLAYSLPVLCKISTGRRHFLPGPFHLGPRLSYINNVVSVVWVLTVTILFTLPQYYPIALLNMNWSGPILGLALAFSLGWYFFPYNGARKWFIGPRANLGQFQDILPSELARIASQEEAKAAAMAAEAAGGAAAGDTATAPPSDPRSRPPPSGVAAAAPPLGLNDGPPTRRDSLTGGANGAVHGGAAGISSTGLSRLSLAMSTATRSPRATPTVTMTGLGTSASIAASASALVGSLLGIASPAAADQEGNRGGAGGGTPFVSQSNAIERSSGRRRYPNGGGSPVGYRRTTAAAGTKTRRHSALSLLDGPVSCGSHIAVLLQDGDGLDMTEEDEAAFAPQVASGDGRGPNRLTRPTADRQALFCSQASLGKIDPWFITRSASVAAVVAAAAAGGASSGGAPPDSNSQQRPPLLAASRDRSSQLLSNPRHNSQEPCGSNGSMGGPSGVLARLSGKGLDPAGSDVVLHRACRARLRRASVSVIALPIGPSAGAGAPVCMAPTDPRVRADEFSASVGATIPYAIPHDLHANSKSAKLARPTFGVGGGGLRQRRTSVDWCVIANGGGTSAASRVPLALQHRVAACSAYGGYGALYATAGVVVGDCKVAEGVEGARTTVDGVVNRSRIGRVSVCTRAVPDPSPASPLNPS